MKFTLTNEQSMIHNTAREFARKEVAPIADEIDTTDKYPFGIIKSMSDFDFLGIITSSQFGGIGLSAFEFAIVVEEISAVSAALGVSLAINGRFAYDISALGTDEQKEKYLPAHSKGEKLGAIAFTEPNGGSNWPMTAQTNAVLEGDHYIVNGSKCFTSNAGVADVYIVMARTNEKKGPQGISAFLIDRDTPGFTFGNMENKFGLRGYPTGELFFDSCRIPKKNILGKEGEGFKNFQASGPFTFISTSAVYVGLAQVALDTCIQFAKGKESIPPSKLSQLESIQGTVSEMAAEIESSRLLMLKASTLVGTPNMTPLLAVLKCCRMALKVTGDAVALQGGYGCLQENLANRLFRDAKTLSLQMTYDKFKSVVGKRLMDVP